MPREPTYQRRPLDTHGTWAVEVASLPKSADRGLFRRELIAPLVDGVPQVLVGEIVEGKLLAGEPMEATAHFGQDRSRKASVLLGGQLAQAIEAPLYGLSL